MRYSIYEGNLERLEKKMTRIQSKCRKYGCDFRFEEVGEEYKEFKDDLGEVYTVRYVIVEAEGIAKINDWQFVGTLQHTDNGNIFRKAINDVEIPERYYTCELACEHCYCKRNRTETYIIRNVETGEFKQVGKNCLGDFTHGMSAEAVAEYISMFDSLIAGETPYTTGRIERYLDTEKFLRYASECVRCFGYVKSDDGQRSTKERAIEYYTLDNGGYIPGADYHSKLRREMKESGFNPDSDNARENVKQALAWIDEQPESNNYMHNLKTACGLEYNKHMNCGILVSLFPTMNRELEREEQKKAEKKSEFIGEIGKRISFKVAAFRCVTSWMTQWGMTMIYKIIDEDGNVYTWKTSTDIPDDVTTIKGTVKAHTEYRGTKQTELTRCKVAIA